MAKFLIFRIFMVLFAIMERTKTRIQFLANGDTFACGCLMGRIEEDQIKISILKTSDPRTSKFGKAGALFEILDSLEELLNGVEPFYPNVRFILGETNLRIARIAQKRLGFKATSTIQGRPIALQGDVCTVKNRLIDLKSKEADLWGKLGERVARN